MRDRWTALAAARPRSLCSVLASSRCARIEPPPGGPPDAAPRSSSRPRPDSLARARRTSRATPSSSSTRSSPRAARRTRAPAPAISRSWSSSRRRRGCPRSTGSGAGSRSSPARAGGPTGCTGSSCCPVSPTSAATAATRARCSPSRPARRCPTTTLEGHGRRLDHQPARAGALVEAVLLPDSLPYRGAGRFERALQLRAAARRATTSCSGVLDQNRNQRADGARGLRQRARLARARPQVGRALGLRARHDAAPHPRRHGGRQRSATIELCQSSTPASG